jgi:ABC-type transport system involved in cytochrome c biogenesis permease subunit
LLFICPVYRATVRLAKVYTCVTVVSVPVAAALALVLLADEEAAALAVHVAACSTFPVAAAHVWFPEIVYPELHVGVHCAPVERIAGQFPRAPLVGAAVTHPPTQVTTAEELLDEVMAGTAELDEVMVELLPQP